MTAEKEGIQDIAAKSRPSGTPRPKPRKKVETYVTKLQKRDSDISDSEFTTHESDRFTEQGDCEDRVDFNQPLEANDFVLLKLATKKAVKYFIGLIQKMKPDF